MDISFASKKVLVTGAGQGIGCALAKRLVKYGAEVVAISRTKAHLDALASEEPTIRTYAVDLSDWAATRAVVESIGAIDCLVNNAAYASLAPFLEVTPEDFDKSFAVNVKAVINVSQVVAQGMVNRKNGGSIVNVSSQASQVNQKIKTPQNATKNTQFTIESSPNIRELHLPPTVECICKTGSGALQATALASSNVTYKHPTFQAALQDHTVYCGTKGALDMISRVMALELGPHQIRVNCVNPTVVMTAMGKIGWSKPEKAGPMLAKIPLGKFAEVDDVVDAIVYLLSDKAAMINGVMLPIDGGFLAC